MIWHTKLHIVGYRLRSAVMAPRHWLEHLVGLCSVGESLVHEPTVISGLGLGVWRSRIRWIHRLTFRFHWLPLGDYIRWWHIRCRLHCSLEVIFGFFRSLLLASSMAERSLHLVSKAGIAHTGSMAVGNLKLSCNLVPVDLSWFIGKPILSQSLHWIVHSSLTAFKSNCLMMAKRNFGVGPSVSRTLLRWPISVVMTLEPELVEWMKFWGEHCLALNTSGYLTYW